MAINSLIEEHFPKIEKTIFDYVSDVLHNGKEYFNSVDDVFESVGEILLDVSVDSKKSEGEVLQFCQQILDSYGRFVSPTSPSRPLTCPLYYCCCS